MRDEKRWWERRLRSVRVWAAVSAELDTLPCGGNGHLPHHDVLMDYKNVSTETLNRAANAFASVFEIARLPRRIFDSVP